MGCHLTRNYKLNSKRYAGIKGIKSRSVRRKISLGTKDEEEAKERRELFYEEWEELVELLGGRNGDGEKKDTEEC